ncbi:hypothetical protein TraAM80_08677 [Trypanosoma rangeli]|uniref:Uncharacterized protein n=1 Tax=Trypanosoma rangeli TaxID=5698 RepID=A0A422MZB0_TRYRA|nr:uncharacterized protein TraAM80_08677 [Trypanosoma rangeli]RNE98575.1 hypothetical protein TraAM80_08677 [Trypanosoma rangeli]|eukprot:RNE98575.1 hypothetical protein TraAM80_08677 [Trypanosoma rangeli]
MRRVKEGGKQDVAGSSAQVLVHEMGPGLLRRASPKQRRRSTRGVSDTAELTVSCAMSEVLNSGLHGNCPTLDAQLYLRRRVAEIVRQIESASSAHHFYRHVVEIDELLRCDAPMGFTPSMVLAGVPDILYMLSDAVKQGYLLYPTEVDTGTVQALTPLRRNPVNSASIAPSAAAMPLAVLTRTSVGSLAAQTGEREERIMHRSCTSSKIGAQTRMKSGTGIGEVTTADLRSFLPPLVRRPAPPPSTESLQGKAEGEVSISAGPDARHRNTARMQSQYRSASGTTTGKARMGEKPLLPRARGGARMNSVGTDAVHSSQSQLCMATSVMKQQEQQKPMVWGEKETYDVAFSPPPPILRDIPSALQALLYHCALPLVCLTLDDQHQRTTAIRLLASAMASILRVTPDCVHVKPIPDQTDEADVASNNDKVVSGEENGVKWDASAVQFKEILYRIRHAALTSLNVLMTHVDAEELKCVNQHFASRDKRTYEATDVAMLPHVLSWRERNREETTTDQVTESQVSATKLSSTPAGPKTGHVVRLTRSHLNASWNLPRKERRHRTVPVSLHNCAVAVDVFRPLIERWTAILRYGVVANALLDSSRQLFHHPALVTAGVMEKKEYENGATVVILPTASDADISPYSKRKEGGSSLSVSKIRMEEEDAGEIYLLLRACLHLSTYKQHARCLIAPDDSSGAAYTSFPVLLCLTMARCAEGDRCLALCVECLWNLLEVVPEETVAAILRHRVQAAERKHYEKERTLSSLSASESLLYCFLQVLLTGHRRRHRELRNDMVVLFMMILRSDTAVLRKQQEVLQHSADAAAYTPLPPSAICAINALVTTVFDMVCGPELRENGKMAQMIQRPVETFLRYHTVLSPTTRVENVQFKLLGWRMLEAFYEWQNARLTVEYLSRDHRPLTRDTPLVDTIDDYGVGDEYKDGGNTLIFDLCYHGFIHVLLLYVDTICSEEPVVAWSREELLMLQEEAWFVLLGLMESAVAAPPASLQDEMGRSELSAQFLSTSAENSTLDESVIAKLPLVKADTQFVAANGILCAVRYICEVTTRDAEALVCLAVRVLSVLSRCPAHRPALLTASMLTFSSASSFTESVPLLLEVAVHVLLSFMERALPAVALPSLLASSKVCKGASSSMPSHYNFYADATGSTLSGVANGRSLMQSKAMTETPRRCAEAVRETPSTIAGFSTTPEGNWGEKAYFKAAEVDVVVHCLLLLNNIVDGDPVDALATQQAFISLNGVSLLLFLARASLAVLPSASSPYSSMVDGGRSELLLAVLSCFRTFILGNAVAQAQFVHEDGVHVLLSIIAVLVGWWEHAALKGPKAITTGDNSPLTPTLTFLADILYESEEAQEAFLQWSTYDMQKPNGMEDDDCTNATQLLLRLWEEGEEEKEEEEGDLEGIAATTPLHRAMARGAATQDNDAPNIQNAEEKVVTDAKEDEEEEEKRVPKDATGGLDDLSSDIGSDGGAYTKTSEAPILHPDRWGLGLIGIHDRESLKAELLNRYSELEGANVEVSESTSATDATTLRARRRLSAALHRVLGLRAKVYACFDAVGFHRIINVKTSAMERVKLLHAAALPSLCEDEVWAAVSEAVDLHDQVVIISRPKGSKKQVSDEVEVASRPPLVVNPIIPDADQLVRVLVDVEARTTELQNLSQLCLDMYAAHKEEATQQFLLSRLRQGADDTKVLALVQQARRRFDPIGNKSTGSIFDHVMSRVERPGMEHVELVSAFSRTPEGTGTVGNRRLSTSRLTLLQKKRKREVMIKSSYRKS